MNQSKIQRLWNYVRPYWRSVVFGVIALLVVNLIGVYIPLLIRDSIDTLSGSLTFAQISKYVFLIFIYASIMWVIRMVSRIILFGVGRQVEYDLKQRLFQHILRLEPAYFATNSIGDLMSRATSDVDNIRRLLGFAVLSIANALFTYALTLPVMLAINIRLSLAALAVYPFMLVLVQLFSDKLREDQREVQENLSDLSQLIQEDMSGISLIKIYAQEANETVGFQQKNAKLLKANLSLARTRNLLFPIIEGLVYISLLILLWLGSGAIAQGILTVGDFLALILYVERLVFPTALLGFTITTYQRGEVSIDRVESVLLAQPAIRNPDEAITLPPELVQGKIEIKDLTFTYPGTKKPALKDISCTIEPGETIAIVGSIGCGKSTLANAIPRLLDIEPGHIFLDGHDVTQLRLNDLREAIAYVPQDSFLFSTQIRNNIRYGQPLAEQPEVEDAAQQAQIHPEILNFPSQYDTLVGERGITLSGGQRQRASLARALMIDAPVLILDDALSSVDNKTATDILDFLSQGTARQTVIFISHQLSAAATADRIFVMDQGQIVQKGSHQELVEQVGPYKHLWQQQQLEKVLE
ncbi:ABC transporter ATP-binding protein/permease [Spirulina subsalsa FACHB-351]|uniref:ABC transporter ATP-binding protein/permease n=1 Tax=Spirulina subsalsa FACHB-351 TaxID=234711 RepID=A0ABT3L670_9CYAN|nr:ABC transporter ATP-binding protein [Spirulina subsalsa]MCW6036994.1 ABC transporter ATP-binding protein/permease [Spirulina subsalsa FACHB-351]